MDISLVFVYSTLDLHMISLCHNFLGWEENSSSNICHGNLNKVASWEQSHILKTRLWKDRHIDTSKVKNMAGVLRYRGHLLAEG